MKDLFETPELLPAELQTLLNNFADQENDYSTCATLLKECEAIGYTFEYGLDAEPHSLRKMKITPFSKRTNANIYLEYVTDWLTVRAMAENYGRTEKEMLDIIDKGRGEHEAGVLKGTPHNPNYKLVSVRIQNKKFVYGETNNGENEGLEVYHYKEGADHFYYSRRYSYIQVPIVYLMLYRKLKDQMHTVKPGCKLILTNEQYRAIN